MKTFSCLLGMLLLLSCTDPKSELRNRLERECITEGAAQFGQGGTRPYFEAYCKCAAEKMSAKFTEAELGDLKKKGEAGLQAAMQPVVEPCLEELTRKTATADSVR